MKKGLIIGAYVLVTLFCCKQAFAYVYNEVAIGKYNDDDFSADLGILFIGNWFQSDIVYYNEGNIHYQNAEYKEAIDDYKKALEENPTEERECDIRINLALAMIKTLGDDYANPEKVEESIKTLKEARNILLEKGCATEGGNGHSEEAQQLKEEIDKMLNELGSEPDEPEDDGDTGETPPEGEEDDDSREENIKQQLQEQQNDSYRERYENLDWYNSIDDSFDYYYDGKIW